MMNPETRQLSDDELEQTTGGASHRFLRYTVKAGDTLQSIASQYGCMEKTILRLNPNLREGSAVRSGIVLTIPTA